MPAQMFRAPASKVRNAGNFSFIQDGGMMRGAPPGSAGNYLFTEVGAGVKPLVLIGDINETLLWMMNHARDRTKGIDNQIQSLPDIYMSVSLYRPKPRFVGLFPFQDTIMAILDKVKGAARPAGIVGDALETSVKVLEKKKSIYQKATHTSRTTKSNNANLLAVTWSYLPGKGFEKIATGFVSFEALYGYTENKLLALHGE